MACLVSIERDVPNEKYYPKFGDYTIPMVAA